MGEFGFVERVRRWMPPGPAHVPIGDDAAVLPVGVGCSLVATTDALVDGTHFRLDWSTPADAGFKAAVANISDLAAMGAEPRWLLVALLAPGTATEELLDGLYAGLREACELHDAVVVGGDTVRGGTLALAVTALGEVRGEPLRRTGARPGDVLAVTGPLGLAQAGVHVLLAQSPPDVPAEDVRACLSAHRRPRARVPEGRRLREWGAHAALDLSDGLYSDALRLAEASGVGVEIDADAAPIAPAVRRVEEAMDGDPLETALGGGEDYELLVALPADRLEGSGVELHPVGRVVEEGMWLVRAGERRPLPGGGWDHFHRSEAE